MQSPEAAIEAAGLTKSYGRRRGIEDVTFSVPVGEIFGFLGPNGAGKTTTIRVLLGFMRPHKGSSRVLGKPPRQTDRSRLGVVPGELSLFEHMTGAYLLDYLESLTGRPAIRRDALVERFGLSSADLGRPIRHYSRGMKQKLGIVQALQHDPELLIMDEPTEGLDPLMQQEFYGLLGELRAQGRTVFVSSHILYEVERTCDRVAIIREGRLVATERIDELRQRLARRVEAHFASASEAAAFVPPAGVTVEHRQGSRVSMRVPLEEVNAVMRALAERTLTDVVWERPSLEDIFLAYYRETADAH
jgi:ABC-2 type transport system ATP-binding protein